MKVEVFESFKTIHGNIYDIDIEKYKKWLNGRESNDDLLLDYIYCLMGCPIDDWEDDSEFVTSYINDSNNIHSIINNGREYSKKVSNIILNIVANAPQPMYNYFTIFLTTEEAEYLKSRSIGKVKEDYYEYLDHNFYRIYITDNKNN